METKAKLAMAISLSLYLQTGATEEVTNTNNLNNTNNKNVEKEIETITITGIRGSILRSLNNKRFAENLVDGISSEDLGKFPDQNVAESLQRITGVSIDRSGGEGQFVSVRGFGPQFNTVLINGRQMATENPGREFSFDILPAELINGADVYKTPTASMQEGGIGATINVSTARPFDFEGFKAMASVKGVYDEISGDTSPQTSGLITNTFMDDTFGVLVSFAQQERKLQSNKIHTNSYRSNVSFTAKNGKEFNNVFMPQNFDLIADTQERTRTSGSVVLQYAPSDRLKVTLDGLVSEFTVDSDTTSVGHWFTESNFADAKVDESNTIVYIENSETSSTDFIRRNFNRQVDMTALGLNIEYDLSDALKMTADLSTSTAKEGNGADGFFNVIGYRNASTWDYRNGGDYPILTSAGGKAGLTNATKARAHYNEKKGWIREDKINELRVDFVWSTEFDTFTQMRWGLYNQERNKTARKVYSTDCPLYCGYGSDVPDDIMFASTANDFFDGMPNTWLSYDVDAYAAFRAKEGVAALQKKSDLAGDKRDIAAEYAAFNYDNPTSQADAYGVKEEILSAYVDFAFEGALGDLPWSAVFGLRYSKTEAELAGVSRKLIDLKPITDDPTDLEEFYETDVGIPVAASNSYTNILPTLNVKFDLTDDMILRFAYSETLTRPTMDALNPAVSVTVSRPNNLQATGGNSSLKPFTSTNWDMSYEWYYADASYFSAAVFSKEVEDFITNTVARETFNLLSGDVEFEVRRPRNGQTAEVNGLELAWSHAWGSGFGLQANATVVSSDAVVDASTGQSFALEGLGDSQNVVAFYEKGPFQARVAFNNRKGFIQNLVSPYGGTDPMYTESYGQWDISSSYDLTDNVTIFAEGINITGEDIRRHGAIKSHFIEMERNGTRWALGVRASF